MYKRQPKDVILTSFVEFCLWNAQDDMTNFQRNFSTGEVEVEGSVIYHKTEYRERRNHYAFYAVNTPVDGFDTDMETFLGLYNGFENPQAVFTGKMGNSIASGWQPMAAHQVKVSLAPGEERRFNFVLGYVEVPQAEKFVAPSVINKAPAKALLEKLTTDEQIADAFDALKKHWDNLLSAYVLTTPDEKLGRMVNIWNPYQCMVTFNMSRSTSMFESGIGRGMGFRDSSQDLLGFVHQIPERARERILDIAATQFRDGGCYHQYQPLTKKGNLAVGSGFNDDPLWLIAGTDAYLRETGDWTILDEPTFGEGKNSWLTGTAAWTFVSISQAILGIQPTLEGLAIDPCIPAGRAGYTIKRRYRGAVYRITVENPHHAEKGIVSLTVNGTPITGNVLPPAAPGTEVQVRVVMG